MADPASRFAGIYENYLWNRPYSELQTPVEPMLPGNVPPPIGQTLPMPAPPPIDPMASGRVPFLQRMAEGLYGAGPYAQMGLGPDAQRGALNRALIAAGSGLIGQTDMRAIGPAIQQGLGVYDQTLGESLNQRRTEQGLGMERERLGETKRRTDEMVRRSDLDEEVHKHRVGIDERQQELTDAKTQARQEAIATLPEPLQAQMAPFLHESDSSWGQQYDALMGRAFMSTPQGLARILPDGDVEIVAGTGPDRGGEAGGVIPMNSKMMSDTFSGMVNTMKAGIAKLAFEQAQPEKRSRLGIDWLAADVVPDPANFNPMDPDEAFFPARTKEGWPQDLQAQVQTYATKAVAIWQSNPEMSPTEAIVAAGFPPEWLGVAAPPEAAETLQGGVGGETEEPKQEVTDEMILQALGVDTPESVATDLVNVFGLTEEEAKARVAAAQAPRE
jgi:hypothetical protein